MKRFLQFAFLLLAATAFGQTPPWNGILDTTRAINWAATNPGVVGGIPDASWTQCGSTIAAYSGTAATINSALAACGSVGGHSNTYALLGAGTFTLYSGILISTNNNVVLRGYGPISTILKFIAGSNCDVGDAAVCIQGTTTDELSTITNRTCGPTSAGTNCTNWTAGYTQGTTSITLSNVKNLAVGQAQSQQILSAYLLTPEADIELLQVPRIIFHPRITIAAW